MSDEQTTVFSEGQVAGQPSDGNQAVTFPEGEQKPFVTAADIEAILSRELGKLEQRMKSQYDKADTSILKQVEARLKRLDQVAVAEGLPLNDPELQLVRSQIKAEALLSSARSSDEVSQTELPQRASELKAKAEEAMWNARVLEANAKAAELSETYGLVLDASEQRKLDQSTPEKWVETMGIALRDKALRMGRTLPGAQAQTEVSPEARLSSLGRGGISADQLTEVTERLDKMMREHPDHTNDIRKLSEEQLALLKAK
jgi:hypothetical protein